MALQMSINITPEAAAAVHKQPTYYTRVYVARQRDDLERDIVSTADAISIPAALITAHRKQLQF